MIARERERERERGREERERERGRERERERALKRNLGQWNDAQSYKHFYGFI
jgi:hypothetical protein